MKQLIVTMLIFGLVFITGCGAKESPGKTTVKQHIKSQPKRAENTPLAPNFTLATMNGEMVSMSDLKGKVVLVNFWGTWCGPCRKEIPDFNSLYHKYHQQGLEIVGVTLTSGGPDKIQNFMNKWKMKYTVLTDINGNETQKVTTDYGRAMGKPITGIPTTFIVDRDGYIVKSYLGPRSEEIFYNDLKPYL